MTPLDRLLAQISVAVVLVAALAGWLAVHNHHEQAIGAQACVQDTTMTKSTAAADTAALEAAHAAQLTQVVAIYDEKLKNSLAANADLAQRLHDYPLRGGTVSAVGAPAGFVCRPAAESASDRAVVNAAQAVIDACTADAIELAGVQAAWRAQTARAP